MSVTTQLPNAHEERQQELDLNLYVRALIRSRTTVFRSIAVAFALALLYLFLATPQYSSNVLLQSAPSNAYSISSENASPSLASGDSNVLAGIEILTSRRVVGKAVDKLNLDIVAEPKHFPLLGAPLTRFFNLFDDDPNDLRSPVLGLQSFAWGGERIVVDQFDIPAYFEDQAFELVVRESGTFELLDAGKNVVLAGNAGQSSSGSITMPDGVTEELSILLRELVGHIGTRFSVKKLPRVTAVADYQENLIAVEVSANSGIIDLSYEGPDPRANSDILDAVVQAYLEENVLKKLNELDRMLGFVDGQLPELRANLQLAQGELSQFYKEYGGVDIDLETSALLEQLEEVQDLISAIELLRVDYVRSYTAQHPILTSLDDKTEQLNARKAEINAQLAELPESEIFEVNVERNVETASKIYLELLQMRQELSVAKAGVGSDIWIVDQASIPIETSSPHYLLVPLLAVFAGGFFGVVMVLFNRRNVEVIESPNVLDSLDIPVIPIRHSPNQKKMDRLVARNKAPAESFLAQFAPLDVALDGLRDLRNILLLPQEKKWDSHPLLLCAAVPNSGQAFVANNLMYLLAESGKSVVVVDADLRGGGHIGITTDQRQVPGLSEVVLNNLDLNDALKEVTHRSGVSDARISTLGAGGLPADSMQVVMSDRFAEVMSSLNQQFDIVLILTPPIIGGTDAVIISKLVKGSCLMIIRTGQLIREEVDSTIRRFTQEGNEFCGVVLNDVAAGLGYGD